MAYCSECGVEIIDHDARFCTECGKLLSGENTNIIENSPAVEEAARITVAKAKSEEAIRNAQAIGCLAIIALIIILYAIGG